MLMDYESYLAHYGTPRHSGRYPWGSGEHADPQRSRSFLDDIDNFRRSGMTDVEIARGLDLTTTQLRALRSIATNQQKLAQIARAQQLKDKGLSNVAIGKAMDLNESSVRSLLEPGKKDRSDVLTNMSNLLQKEVDERGFIDVGAGVENHLDISSTRLNTVLEILKQRGYSVHNVQIDQVFGNGTQKTTTKVLAPPGTTYRDIVAAKDKIGQLSAISSFSEDGGRTVLNLQPPLQVNSKRIGVVYKENGGDKADGVIYVRPGVDDLSLGSSKYAQVRIAVDGTHYLKGMALYKDDMPDGVDLLFNTNKSDTGNKLDAMKAIKDDPDNPFGSLVRQRIRVDEDGRQHVTSAMNIVGLKEGSGEEGGWDTWSKSLSTQLLSKQSPKLAQQQLDVTYERKQQEFEDLKALTNPTVRNKLLESFSDGVDSSAVHLKAAALPGQRTQVILPINSLTDKQVYAPNFRNGDQVALIRYPHGGTFEIPILTVNNRNKEAQERIGRQAKDAIAINSKVAERLSGADFDGDTVVVIPNNNGQIKSTPALKSLQGFDNKRLYGFPKDIDPKDPRVMSSRQTQMQMGLISNLITDMTIKGATPDELARAVRHSMVVIDAEKHKLDWKRSYEDNGIRQLNIKYQAKPQGGSSTLVSRATSQQRVNDRELRRPADGGPIDPKTGNLVYVDKTYVDRTGALASKKIRSTKLAEAKDAFDLVSDPGTPIEVVYANHSNRLKALANEARKEVAAFEPPKVSRSAKSVYASEVQSLNAKLSLSRRNKPLERQAQVFANAVVAQKRQANPNLDAADVKKIKAQALDAARIRTGASKYLIEPTPREWQAIQAGAISHNQLNQILNSANLDRIKELATPRENVKMTSAKETRARSMLAAGYNQSEVAEALGVSVSTLKASFKDGDT